MKTANGKRHYGCWAGNPNGTEEDPTRCIHEVFLGDRGGTHYQCRRKRGFGKGGLYCRQHDPAAIEKKNKARHAEFDKERRRQAAIEKQALALADKLDVAGYALYHHAARFRDCGFVEQLVIPFSEAEKLIARLGKK